MKIEILGAARQDLLDGYRFYEKRAEAVGAYFVDTLISDIDSLIVTAGVHPTHFGGYYRLLIDDLRRQTEQAAAGHAAQQAGAMVDMFADFNGLPDTADKTDFYQHDAHWSNRMILGDSLQVMASLAEREGLRGQRAVAGPVQKTGLV